MKQRNDISVAEWFYSVQGEGITSGTPSIFLRLAGCNLLCGRNDATWTCDSIEVWKNGQTFNVFELIRKMNNDIALFNRLKHANLVITGGEPLQQQQSLCVFLHEIRELTSERGHNVVVEVETNGTITPSMELNSLVNIWNVSPKLSNSGEPIKKRFNLDAVRIFNASNKAQWKFVVTRHDDLKEIIAEWCPVIEDETMIQLMSGADNRKDLDKMNQWLIKKCLIYGFRFTNRLQIQVWNEKTGI